MAHTNKTAYLNEDWDIELESDGSIKMCTDDIYAGLVTAFRQAIHRVSTEIEIKDIIIDDIDVETRKVTGTIKIIWKGNYGEYNF